MVLRVFGETPNTTRQRRVLPSLTVLLQPQVKDGDNLVQSSAGARAVISAACSLRALHLR